MPFPNMDGYPRPIPAALPPEVWQHLFGPKHYRSPLFGGYSGPMSVPTPGPSAERFLIARGEAAQDVNGRRLAIAGLQPRHGGNRR